MKNKKIFSTVISVFVVFAVLIGCVSILNHVNKSSFDFEDPPSSSNDPPSSSNDPTFKTLYKWDFSETTLIEEDALGNYYNDDIRYFCEGDYSFDNDKFELFLGGQESEHRIHFGYDSKTLISDFSYYTIDFDFYLPYDDCIYSNIHSFQCNLKDDSGDDANIGALLNFDNGQVLNGDAAELSSYESGSYHISYLLSSDNEALVYINGIYCGTVEGLFAEDASYIEGFSFSIQGDSGTYSIDDVEIRAYDPGYNGPISNLFTDHAPLNTCPDSVLYEG